MTQIEIVFVGQGGQGVRLVSTLLGKVCAAAGKQIASSASYGPEVRGTYTRSEVIVSDEMIVYPRVLCPDISVALSQEACDRVYSEVPAGGTILYEAEAVKPSPDALGMQIPIPAIEIATELHSPASANMVMLGAVVALTGLVNLSALKGALPARRRVENGAALDRGTDMVKAVAIRQQNSGTEQPHSS